MSGSITDTALRGVLLKAVACEHFRCVVVVDFEYEVSDSSLPNPLCMSARVLDQHLCPVKTIRLWRGEFGRVPPFDIGDDSLICGYALFAEMQCFLALGWPFPVHVFDLHTAFLAATNFLLPVTDDDAKRIRLTKKLPDACRLYGIRGWEGLNKSEMAADIGNGTWRGKYSPQEILHYVEEDTARSIDLLIRMLQGVPGHGVGLEPANAENTLYWSNYSAKVIARVQAKGMPIDVPRWNLIRENDRLVIQELRRRFDPSFNDPDPIFDEDGSYSQRRFAQYLVAHGIPWPRLASGALDMSDDAFELMQNVPGVVGVHVLKNSLRVIVGSTLPIGPDGINRPSLFPFGTATSRNAHCRSLFNCHAGLRGLIKFPEHKVGCYLDVRTQEIAIAAVKSGDEALMRAYSSGDVYHGFAIDADLTTERSAKAWKNTPEGATLRQKIKSLYLGINYGMTVPSIARKLDRHPLIASELLELHRRRYPRFWQWRENEVWCAMLSRRMESDDGWPLHITYSPNERSLFNFPMQSGGAVQLRAMALALCDADLVPSMLVHDGILFELDNFEQVDQAQAIMAKAAADCCGGFPIGIDEDQKRAFGLRFRDKRPVAQDMWATIMDVLTAVGALAA